MKTLQDIKETMHGTERGNSVVFYHSGRHWTATEHGESFLITSVNRRYFIPRQCANLYQAIAFNM